MRTSVVKLERVAKPRMHAAVVAFVAGCLTQASASEPTHRLTYQDRFALSEDVLEAVNDLGWIVGTYYHPNMHGAHWGKAWNGPSIDSRLSSHLAVNNSGTIVGTVWGGQMDPVNHAAISTNGVRRIIAGPNSVALAINDAQQVLGRGGRGGVTLWRWNAADESFTDIDIVQDSEIHRNAQINQAGVVAVEVEGQVRAWSESGGKITWSAPQGARYELKGLSNTGWFAANARNAAGWLTGAFLRKPTGEVIDLGVHASIIDMSNSGIVLLTNYTAASGTRLFTWTETGGMKEIITPPSPADRTWRWQPMFISDGGQIAGTMEEHLYGSLSSWYNVTLLAPVPSPGGSALMLAAALCGTRRRRA